MKDRGVVSLVAGADRQRGVRESITLLDPGRLDDLKVMIKPNFNTADPAPGSTHNDTLRELVLAVRDLGAASITIGERSGPPETRQVMNEKGIPELAKELDVDIVDFDRLPGDDWVHFTRPSLHWEDGFHVPRPLLEADAVVATACVKTHAFGGVISMALKLAVGICEKLERGYMKQMHRSPHMRKMIAELNLAYTPRFTVLDGVDIFTDGGPAKGERKQANVILCSTDRVALDAVGTAVLKHMGANDDIMGRPIFAQEQIVRAVELGLGASGPSEIEIITGDDESRELAKKLREILDRG